MEHIINNSIIKDMPQQAQIHKLKDRFLYFKNCLGIPTKRVKKIIQEKVQTSTQEKNLKIIKMERK